LIEDKNFKHGGLVGAEPAVSHKGVLCKPRVTGFKPGSARASGTVDTLEICVLPPFGKQDPVLENSVLFWKTGILFWKKASCFRKQDPVLEKSVLF
jgi:hypothetical protein